MTKVEKLIAEYTKKIELSTDRQNMLLQAIHKLRKGTPARYELNAIDDISSDLRAERNIAQIYTQMLKDLEDL